mgnify:CR=1 FL=1
MILQAYPMIDRAGNCVKINLRLVIGKATIYFVGESDVLCLEILAVAMLNRRSKIVSYQRYAIYALIVQKLPSTHPHHGE